ATAAKSGESAATAKGTSENVAKLTEDVIHIHSVAISETAAIKCLVTVLIVTCTLLWIAQHFIVFGCQFEIFLCFLTTRILVGVEFDRLFSIRFFYFRRIGIFADSE